MSQNYDSSVTCTSADASPKVALITGASRRLGLYVCERLLAAHWQVHVVTRSGSGPLNELHGHLLHVHLLPDYTPSALDVVVAKLRREIGDLDLLLNNASVFVDDVQALENGGTLLNAMNFAHQLMPQVLVSTFAQSLQCAHGCVIDITDIYADNPKADYSLYCSSKAALQNLMKSQAQLLAPEARAMAIAPGPIQFLPEHDQHHQDLVMSETLLTGEGGFEPVYRAIEFILANSYVTGSTIKVDGGRALLRG